MMKKIWTVILIVLFSLQAVFSATPAEISDALRDQNMLNTAMNELNVLLEQIPQLSMLLGQNRVYHARIGSNNLGITLQNGRVTSITPGTPSNPTHILYASSETINEVLSATDPLTTIINIVTQGKIVIIENSECRTNNECADNEVCSNGQCRSAYTIAVVPLGYASGEYDAFYNAAQPEVQLVAQYIPMNNQYLRVHYVNPSVCANLQCTDVCRDCQSTSTECARRAGLVGVADKVVAVSKGDVATYINGQPLLLCGCAAGIPSYTSVSRSRLYVTGGVYCYQTVIHELGHQLGLYHVNAVGNEGGACQGPNAADCNDANKMTDIMGYAWPQDHFGPAANTYLRSNVLNAYQ